MCGSTMHDEFDPEHISDVISHPFLDALSRLLLVSFIRLQVPSGFLLMSKETHGGMLRTGTVVTWDTFLIVSNMSCDPKVQFGRPAQ